MTQPTHPPTYCAYCTYRHATGSLTVRVDQRTRTDPICWTCAREALANYATQPAEATYRPGAAA